jgi:predicted AAA+ superfamily ATPase
MSINKKNYLFIDEPQVIKNWEVAIRSIYDELNVSIFITGSSSKLLSKEIATSLRGRALSTILPPLSFGEFLNFKDEPFEPKKISSAKKAKIKYFLNEFIQFGSFPEIVLENNKEEKIRITKDYLDLTIYKDIIERYNIKNTNLIKILIDLAISSCSKEFSINKHYNDLKSRDIKLSKNTLYEYFSALEDSFFVFSLKRFYHSKKSENLSIPKIYLGDLGYLNLLSLDNYGQRFENIVFLELYRKSVNNPLLKINYWQSKKGHETDFIISNGKKIESVIQVCYNLDNIKTKERELNGLLECMEELKIKKGYIINDSLEKEEIINNKKIIYIPLWKWLLNK